MKGGLQRRNAAAFVRALDRFDVAPVRLNRQQETSAHDGAVHHHRTGAADAMLAPDMAARQAQIAAQEIHQIAPYRHLRLDGLAVHPENDAHVLHGLIHDNPARNRSSSRAMRTPLR